MLGSYSAIIFTDVCTRALVPPIVMKTFGNRSSLAPHQKFNFFFRTRSIKILKTTMQTNLRKSIVFESQFTRLRNLHIIYGYIYLGIHLNMLFYVGQQSKCCLWRSGREWTDARGPKSIPSGRPIIFEFRNKSNLPHPFEIWCFFFFFLTFLKR